MTIAVVKGLAGRYLVAAIVAVAMSGCSKSRADLIREYVGACIANDGHPAEVCECAGRHADNELSPASLELLVVTLQGHEKRAARLRDRTGAIEVMAAGTFAVDGPARCEWEVGAR